MWLQELNQGVCDAIQPCIVCNPIKVLEIHVVLVSMVAFKKKFFLVYRSAYMLFVMDNMGSTRMADSGKVDLKKLGEMWKSLSEAEREVSMRLVPVIVLFSGLVYGMSN